MLCQGCDQEMHRETVVRVLRVGAFGRTRSVMRPSWHCWTCRTNLAETESADPRQVTEANPYRTAKSTPVCLMRPVTMFAEGAVASNR
jgi:hypothetical protein